MARAPGIDERDAHSCTQNRERGPAAERTGSDDDDMRMRVW
jgi:hypothetical protein